MTQKTKLAALMALALWGGAAQAAQLNHLKSITVKSARAGAQVVVEGSQAPTFTVFRLPDPDRLVVDVSSADASALKGHHDGQGPVGGVVVSQFSDEKASVGRVLVALSGATQYDVRADGNRMVISVDGQTAPKPAVAAAEPTPAKAEPAVEAKVEAAPEPTPLVAAQTPEIVLEEPLPAAKVADAAPAAPQNVVAATVDEQEVKNPASKIRAIDLKNDVLSVKADGELARFEVIELSSPPRLAVDVQGVGLAAKTPKAGQKSRVREVRAGAHSDKVRIVLDMKGEMPAYQALRTKDGLKLVLNSPQVEAAVAETPVPAKVAEVASAPVAPSEAPATPAAPDAVVDVKDVRFTEDARGGRLELKLTGKAGWIIERPDERSAVLTLDGARIDKKFERSLDTSDLDTPVKMVSTFSVPGDAARVRVVVAAAGALEESAVETKDGLSWRLNAKGVKTDEVAVAAQKTAGFATEAETFAAEGAPRQARYTGKRVSFEFKNIDIHNLLRVIAEISKKNIVVADDVGGTITIRLRNVPWDQALDLILRTKGLGKETLGNIVRIAPLATLETEAKLRAERKKANQSLEETIVNLIPVNYATAAGMADRVRDVLSERGSVTVDQRTNVLIVRDVKSGMAKARTLVQSLDTQTPQVLIESRIVEAATNFSRQVGVQWGGQGQVGPAFGNATGLIFPNATSAAGGAGIGPTAGLLANGAPVAQPNFAVNLPAAVGQGSGGALGFTFGSAGGALGLNLRLSALENQGVVKTISSPKVTTLDNNTAKISQGVSVPFSQASAAGVNTTFIEARLSLEVTPHITQDGSVLMNIRAENNQPDPSATGANGQPSIQRKEAATQVLVKDGDTTVIGGIYVRRGSHSEAGVPFLSKIPVLGFFFRTTTEADQRQELLIFITPRIINRQTIAQSL